MIPHNKPTLGEEEKKALNEVIDSNWLAQGEKTKEFENNFCDFLGIESGSCVACSSGTAALFVALKALGIEGGEIIIPTYVCTSLLNVVYLIGATPVLCDISETDFNIENIKITKNTKAIIVPHMFGAPAKIKDFGAPVIEDCATAIGSRIGDKHVGLFGDIAVFSFYASKMISTGQGGMVFSKNKGLSDKARDYIDFDLGKNKRDYYPRFNFEITDLQSVLGIEQLKKLPVFLEKRKKIASFYEQICVEKGWDFQKPKDKDCIKNNYRFVIKTDKVLQLKTHLEKQGIKTIIPIENWELLHNFLKLEKQGFPNAEKASESTLSLPIFPDVLSQIDKVLTAIREF